MTMLNNIATLLNVAQSLLFANWVHEGRYEYLEVVPIRSNYTSVGLMDE